VDCQAIRQKISASRSVETSSYLTSLLSDAGQLNSAVRSYWGGVENSLHWVLGVTFGEDQSRIKAEHQGGATGSLLGRWLSPGVLCGDAGN
jgi:predicted transposase YbfD/YdcC